MRQTSSSICRLARTSEVKRGWRVLLAALHPTGKRCNSSHPHTFQPRAIPYQKIPIIPSIMTYIEEMFKAEIVQKEGIIRRKKDYIDQMGFFRQLLARVRREQYHLIETG